MGCCCEFRRLLPRWKAWNRRAKGLSPRFLPAYQCRSLPADGIRAAGDHCLPVGLIHAVDDRLICVPSSRKPPRRTSSTEITAGLYCSNMGIEERSFTFWTTHADTAVCPAASVNIAGIKSQVGWPATAAAALRPGRRCRVTDPSLRIRLLAPDSARSQEPTGWTARTCTFSSVPDAIACQVRHGNGGAANDVRHENHQHFLIHMLDVFAARRDISKSECPPKPGQPEMFLVSVR